MLSPSQALSRPDSSLLACCGTDTQPRNPTTREKSYNQREVLQPERDSQTWWRRKVVTWTDTVGMSKVTCGSGKVVGVLGMMGGMACGSTMIIHDEVQIYLSIYLSICPIILWTVGAPHDVTTNLRHSSLSSAFLTVLLSPKPVHSQMLSSHRFLCLPLLLPHCTVPWKKCLGKAWRSCNVPIPLQLALFHNGQEFFVGSNGLPDSASNLFVRNVFSVWDAKESSEASHLHCLDLSLCFCCQCPCLTSVKEHGHNQGAQQSDLCVESNAFVFPYHFKVCKCSCCLGDPREYFRPGSLISDNGSQVFEALNSFKLFATDLDGTADAIDVIRHQLGLLCTDLHAICCWGFVKSLHQVS